MNAHSSELALVGAMASGGKLTGSPRRWTGFLLPVSVFLWLFVGGAIAMFAPAAILGWSQKQVNSHLYLLGPLVQIVGLGPGALLNARLAMGRTEGRARDRVVSLGIGLGAAALVGGLEIAFSGRVMGGTFMGWVAAYGQALFLAPPWNGIFALFVVMAYGPVEALWVVYLIAAFDRAIGHPRPLLSWGVVLVALLWGLPHLLNVVVSPNWSQVVNALRMVLVGIAVGLIFKSTRSALGPVVFWTLTNGTSL